MFEKVTVLEAGLGCPRFQDTAKDFCVESHLQGGVYCSVWVVVFCGCGFPLGCHDKEEVERQYSQPGCCQPGVCFHGSMALLSSPYLGTGDPVEPLMG